MAASIDRLLAADYLEGVDRLSMDELRARRAECQAVETSVSYFRRLVQGRLDIVHAELTRREAGGEPSDLHRLIEQLPAILAEHAGGPARGPLPDVVAPAGLDAFGAELDAIVDADQLASLPDQTDANLVATADRLAQLEGEVSSRRRALQERIDLLQEEIVRRYKRGEATVDTLLP